VAPNATNVVPGHVELWCEMRSVDGPILESRRHAFVERAEEIAARREIGVRIDPVSHEEPVPIAEEIQAGFEQVVRALGLPVRRLPSYAGHDGNQMAKIAPIGMLFVPSRDGRSHCPEEWTDLADVALGAQALGEALLRFDAQPPAARTSAP
jgi:beta-ureidopropionase / N-carbamoyl-L-amino-acid hydrolase